MFKEIGKDIGQFTKEHKKLSIGIGIGIVAAIGVYWMYKTTQKQQAFNQKAQIEVTDATITPVPLTSCTCATCQKSWLQKWTDCIL